MKIAYLTGLLLVVISLSVGASNWRKVASGITGDPIVYVDVVSISKKENLKKAWFRSEYKKAQTTGSYPPKEYRSYKELRLFNCTERTSAIKQINLYTDAQGMGAIVGSESIPNDKLHFTDIVPDSIEEVLFDYVCGQK